MRLDDAYLEFTLSKDWTPATRRWYDARLSHFIAWLESQGAYDFTTLAAPLIRRYIASLSETGSRGDFTIHGHVRAVRTWLFWGVTEDLLDDKLPRRISLPRREKKVMRVLSDSDLAALFRAAHRTPTPRRDVALLSILLDTGCRASEVCGLRRRDVTLGPNESWLLVHGKGRKQREVALGKQATLALHTYLTRERPSLAITAGAARITLEDAVFLRRGGQPLRPEGLGRMLDRLRDAAGLPHDAPVNPHAWRHLNAVRSLISGEDLFSVSRRLGHSGVGVTTGYLSAVSGQQLRRMAHSVLDELKP